MRVQHNFFEAIDDKTNLWEDAMSLLFMAALDYRHTSHAFVGACIRQG